MRPEFWSDAAIGSLTDAVKLFYIGLWNLADDAGWLSWQPEQVAAQLYPYKPATRRTRDVIAWLTVLESRGRVTAYDCECIEVPNLAKHQRVSGVQSTKARDHHDKAHTAAKRLPLTTKQTPRNGSDKQLPLSDSPVEVMERRGRVDVEEGYTTPLNPSRARGTAAVASGAGNPSR